MISTKTLPDLDILNDLQAEKKEEKNCKQTDGPTDGLTSAFIELQWSQKLGTLDIMVTQNWGY
jgi:hypothetical protein